VVLKPRTSAGRSSKPAFARIGVLLGDKGNAFWSAMEAAYLRLGPSLGFDLEHVYAEPEKDPAAQREALRKMITRGFDALIVNPLDRGNLAPVILEAAAHGIRVFDVGGKTEADLVVNAGAAYVPVPTVDFWEQGRIAGRFVAEQLRDLGGAEVAIVEGRPESKQSIGRCGGAAAVLAAEPGITIVARVSGHFDRQRAREAALVVLADHPQTRALVCANDLMALGVAEAVRARPPAVENSRQEPLVVGVDGTPEAIRAVADGLLAATVAFSPTDVARVVLGSVRGVLDGGLPPQGYGVASHLYTGEHTLLERLAQAVVAMNVREAEKAARMALELGVDAYRAVDEGLMRGMAEVGRLFESYEYFVPELLLAGDAMNAALDVLKPQLRAAKDARGTVVLGVVRGDTHDIGKNLVRAMLEAAGFDVVDLGKDVPPERFLQAAQEHGAGVIGLSALMTSTMPGMKDVVDLLAAQDDRRDVRVIVGGAPLSAAFAAAVGADAYSPTALTAVDDVARLMDEVRNP
jgi:dimethylamine corrinoid protein